VSPEVAQTLAREAHVSTAVLNPIESLTKDQIEPGLIKPNPMMDRSPRSGYFLDGCAPSGTAAWS
jgi:hypothetical protein